MADMVPTLIFVPRKEIKFPFGGILHGTGNKIVFFGNRQFPEFGNCSSFYFVFKCITLRNVYKSLDECNHHIKLSELHHVRLSLRKSFSH